MCEHQDRGVFQELFLVATVQLKLVSIQAVQSMTLKGVGEREYVEW